MSINIGAITLVDPRANILINENGSMNLMEGLRISQEEETDEKVTAQEESEMEPPASTGYDITASSTADPAKNCNRSAPKSPPITPNPGS
ncbi:MAG: hypothetical protein O7C75_20495 [Verrucomicrobia bacterium]|nr:hypothetical protein [Verrucomicrobiota bacterium]